MAQRRRSSMRLKMPRVKSFNRIPLMPEMMMEESTGLNSTWPCPKSSMAERDKFNTGSAGALARNERAARNCYISAKS